MIAFNQYSGFKYKVRRFHAFTNDQVRELIQMVQTSQQYSNKKLAFITNRSGQYTATAVRDLCSENDIVLVHTPAGVYDLLASHKLFANLREQFIDEFNSGEWEDTRKLAKHILERNNDAPR
jgi:transposase InsO family protein